MKVQIFVRYVGQAFGLVGVVKGNGRVLHTTGVKPYGFTAAAINAAVTWADKHGHEHGYTWVVEEDKHRSYWTERKPAEAGD